MGTIRRLRSASGRCPRRLFGGRETERLQGLDGLAREMIGYRWGCRGHEVTGGRCRAGNDILRALGQGRAHNATRDLDLSRLQMTGRHEGRSVEEGHHAVLARVLM